MRRLVLFGSMLLAAGGCTVSSQSWTAAGGTEATFQAAASTCDSASLVRFPPMTMGVPGYFATPNEFCSPTAGGTNCVIIGDGYLPQVQSAADTNALPRANAFHACMMAGGWQPVYQAGGQSFMAPIVSRNTVSEALTYCEGLFRGQRNTPPEAAKFHQCVVTRAREPGVPRPPA
jgi:hypothetical protein